MVYYRGSTSYHFDGKYFSNIQETRGRGFWSLLKWMCTRKVGKWPKQRVNEYHDLPPKRVEGGTIHLTFIGHVTCLIQTEGLNILTDPVWSDYASPIQGMGPKRICPPGLTIDQLPKIDIILLSHNHYDHMDLKTLQQLYRRDRSRIYTPLGNDAILQRFDKDLVSIAMDWGDEEKLSDYFSIHLDPLHHWSARTLFDRNQALWGAFILKTPHGSIYFAGDTGFADGQPFRDTYEKHGPMRLALLPIGAYQPQWFMQEMHMNPEEALQAFQLLDAEHGLGIHFGSFYRLADEAYDSPIEDLEKARNKIISSHKKEFRVLKVGQSWKINGGNDGKSTKSRQRQGKGKR